MIYAIHGVTYSWMPYLFEQRILLDSQAFASYLSTRSRFGSLSEAVRGVGDALTIDDSTRAAGEAARLALRYGHEVTMFINGFNIEFQRSYCFSIVNWLLDHTPAKSVQLNGTNYPLGTFAEKCHFRRQIKEIYRYFQDPKETSYFAERLASSLDIEIGPLSNDAAVLSREEMADLFSRGVGIGNHGWGHIDPKHLSVHEFEDHIMQNKEWIRNMLGVSSAFYAVPFGEGVPRISFSEGLFDHCFLLNDKLPACRLSKRVYNRTDLVV